MTFMSVSILPVIVVAALMYLLGWFWYSPKVYGKLWCKSHNIECDVAKKPPLKKMVSFFIVCLVMAFVLACFIINFNIDTATKALFFGFWIWLGFIATTMYGGVIWSKKPLTAYFINSGYYLVGILAMSVILSVWR